MLKCGISGYIRLILYKDIGNGYISLITRLATNLCDSTYPSVSFE